LIETIAMIGSPAWRGAVASLGGGAGRAFCATAGAVGAINAAIAASANVAGGPQRRIAMVDCAVASRFAMLIPIEMPVRACVNRVNGRSCCALMTAEVTVSQSAGDNSSTMFLSTFANCLAYQRVNALRRFFDGAFTTIETDGA
jgi:hypothetical protein